MDSIVRFAIENGGNDYSVMFPTSYLLGSYCYCNPTCVFINNKLVVNSRLVNYKKIIQNNNCKFTATKKNQLYYLSKYGYTSRNILCVVDEHGDTKEKEINYGSGEVDAFYRGLEDCRFVVWNNILYAYGTRWDKIEDKGTICIYELDTDFNPINEIVVNDSRLSKCEKNWGAIEDMPFCFVYKTNDNVIIHVENDGKCTLVSHHPINEKYPDYIKGSTPIIRYSDSEYITLVHRTEYIRDCYGIEKANYHTAFLFYDNEFNITRMSEWFVFRTELCEFTCGMMINNGVLYVPYSQIDCTVNMLEIPLDKIELFMTGGEWPEYDRDYIYNTAKIYENHEQYTSSFALFNYAATMSNENDEIKKECVIKTFIGLINDLEVIKDNKHINKLKKNIQSAIKLFNNPTELYYLLAIIDKYDGDMKGYKRNLEKANKNKALISADYLKYINIDYI